MIKHQSNNKIIALIFEINELLMMDVKFDPDKEDILRQNMEVVDPGYHINNVHWNTVAVFNFIDSR